MSLRRRVLVGFFVVIAALVATNLLLAGTFESYLTGRLDRQLEAAVPRFSRLSGFRPPPPSGGTPSGNQPVTEFYVAVAAANGTGLAPVGAAIDATRSDPTPSSTQIVGKATPVGAPIKPFSVEAADGDHRWRVTALADAASDRIVVVGISMNELDATLYRMRLIQLFGSLVVVATLGAVMWWMLRLGVRPLADMVDAADGIAGGDLSRRIEHTDERTEVGRLGAALNTMLTEIEDAFRQREESESQVRRFAADASHELRTPLTSILGYAQLWRAGALSDERDYDDAMRRIEQEALRMRGLVEDLLLLARLDQGRPLASEPVRLDRLAEDGVADALAVEPDRPVTVSVEPVTVTGDEARLRQVVANLLANTRVHTPAGTPVTVTVRRAGDRALLEVRDEGPGLQPGVGDLVFDRFYRADASRSRDDGGSGLGLAIVAGVAHAHGGAASVDSVPGRGCRFVIDLPVASSHSEAFVRRDSQETPRPLQSIFEAPSP